MASPEEVARASYLLRSKVRLGDVPGVKGLIKAGLIDLTAPGETVRRPQCPSHPTGICSVTQLQLAEAPMDSASHCLLGQLQAAVRQGDHRGAAAVCAKDQD